jgi:hypothetical protein
MSSLAKTTIIKMFEKLPEPIQERVLEHMREYIEDVREDVRWNESFSKTQDKLIAVAHKARQEIAKGKAIPLDINEL